MLRLDGARDEPAQRQFLDRERLRGQPFELRGVGEIGLIARQEDDGAAGFEVTIEPHRCAVAHLGNAREEDGG